MNVFLYAAIIEMDTNAAKKVSEALDQYYCKCCFFKKKKSERDSQPGTHAFSKFRPPFSASLMDVSIHKAESQLYHFKI